MKSSVMPTARLKTHPTSLTPNQKTNQKIMMMIIIILRIYNFNLYSKLSKHVKIVR